MSEGVHVFLSENYRMAVDAIRSRTDVAEFRRSSGSGEFVNGQRFVIVTDGDIDRARGLRVSSYELVGSIGGRSIDIVRSQMR